ncbi:MULTISPECIES: hypothetical protein [Lactococcus]|uniref:Uncharacterized protein n=1 Tax=Lactococcus petauri TaxID=1940789 RepID=A0AAJ2IZT3_9LACT|nr:MULTISPECIES: hypothetical protein [Lactococcus]MCO7181324.1 hypothetical protein [Lactococcus formosensis]MDT2528000.1 hypothetical protein [Lactococcus petauri]MDT2542543.1 hypothetical protein [Lactococcus petauri]MDT2552516.1 hypothetical protein [Lactococcus petauri]MDT2559143.1 hypothetical protein [Lactococcus petauri]
MPYIWVEEEPRKEDGLRDFSVTTVTSDGNEFHSIGGIADSNHIELLNEFEKMEIDKNKILLIIDPLFFGSQRDLKNLSCKVQIINKDQSVLENKKVKIKHPFPNKSYARSILFKGNKQFKFGQVFEIKSIEDLENISHIEIEWTATEISDYQFKVGERLTPIHTVVTKSTIYPQFIFSSVRPTADSYDDKGRIIEKKFKHEYIDEKQPRWYFLNVPEEMYEGDIDYDVQSFVESDGVMLLKTRNIRKHLLPDNSFFIK